MKSFDFHIVLVCIDISWLNLAVAICIMPPRESHKDKTVTKSSNNSSSSNSSEQIDSIFVEPTDQGNDPEQATQTQSKNLRMKNTIFGYEMPFDVISTAFAGVVTLGGIMGYVKASQLFIIQV